MKWLNTDGSVGKESTGNAEYLDSISGLGRSPGEGRGNPPVFLPGESPWTEEPGGLPTGHRVTKSQTWLSTQSEIILNSLYIYDSY